MTAPRYESTCEAVFKCRKCRVECILAFEPVDYERARMQCATIEALHAHCDQGYEPFRVEDLRVEVPDRCRVKLGPPRFVFFGRRPQDVDEGPS